MSLRPPPLAPPVAWSKPSSDLQAPLLDRPTSSASLTSPNQAKIEVRTHDKSGKTTTGEPLSGMAFQKPLPETPFHTTPESSSNRKCDVKTEAQAENNPIKHEYPNEDVDMDAFRDAKDSSELDSPDEDSARSSKKKKSQRFFCQDYPPCQLSFTRSEHLARHIRKHTGERPFQCHCNRRFSRLDNLRQHAQTVHVNEDIPIDSLAATGTRFQRQVRTERVRPVNRSRAATFSSMSSSSHVHRAHSRNLSSSSTTSISSVSTTAPDDMRRGICGFENPRPNRSSLDAYVPTSNPNAMHSAQPYFTVGTNSSTSYSTPASSSLSLANSSPRFPSGIHSPAHSGPKVSLTRLSTFGSQPFQSSHSPDTSAMIRDPTLSHAAVARNSAYVGSSALPVDPRTESTSANQADWRRRTWHPNVDTQLRSHHPTTPQISTQHLTDLPRPIFPSQQSPLQMSTPPKLPVLPKLPGIHTFDQPPPPAVLGSRASSPMQLDHRASLPTNISQPAVTPDTPTHRSSWTSYLQNGIMQLELNTDVKAKESLPWNSIKPNAAVSTPDAHHSGLAQPQPDEGFTSGRSRKRMGWYMQPPQSYSVSTPHRPSVDGISNDGARTTATAKSDYQPAIVQSNPRPNHYPPVVTRDSDRAIKQVHTSNRQIIHPNVDHLSCKIQSNPFALPRVYEHSRTQRLPSLRSRGPDLGRLEALVAVATSEQQRQHT